MHGEEVFITVPLCWESVNIVLNMGELMLKIGVMKV
jgi:hypothetical protein